MRVAILCSLTLLAVPASGFSQTAPTALSGLVIDDTDAELVGEWTSSTSVKPYLGKSYIHDGASGKGEKSAKFTFRVSVAGQYYVLIAYTPGGNRDKAVPVTIHSVDGKSTASLDQSRPPQLRSGFEPLGPFTFSDTTDATVLIATKGTTRHVIVDGVRLLSLDEFKAAARNEKSGSGVKKVAVKTAAEKKPTKPKPQASPFARPVAKSTFRPITPEQFDELLAGTGNGTESRSEGRRIDDVKFLRRVSLDLIGRPPSLVEYHEFLKQESPRRRTQAVERLLASESFGRNWGNYWSDLIAARQPEPQLTYLNYQPFRDWLAARFNAGDGWDETVFRMLTSIGTVGEDPAGTFVGFHQGERNKLAGESARVFLGLRISCAECHDHPFVDMPQQTFHGMAAFFARTKVKLPWNDSNEIAISAAAKGEHKMPGSKDQMAPTVYRGKKLPLGLSDRQRREQLAYWMVSADNPYFARSFVNHIQARLMGRGFFEPVDDQGEGVTVLSPEAHEALAGHFVAAGFDPKAVFRLLVATDAYQKERSEPVDGATVASHGRTMRFTGATAKKLRGDEVFDSLVNAIQLPNTDTKVEASTGESRFPPPPKSTRDLVNEAFGFDPATRDQLLTRTMKQAMFMMNNRQLQGQINAAPGSGSMLARLLAVESDNGVVVEVLFARVLARRPTDKEKALVAGHVETVEDRGKAFEDVLWSLLNSAEFTTRH